MSDRRLRGAAEADRAQPAARRQHRQALHQPRPRAARPDRGGQPRPHPRAGKVRSRARLSLHDLRDVVDPPVDRARDHEPVAHDPAAGARGQGAQRRAARAAPSRDPRHSPRGASHRSTTSRICSASRWSRSRRVLGYNEHVASLDAPVDRDGGQSIGDGIADDERAARRSCCCTTRRSRRGSGSGSPSSRERQRTRHRAPLRIERLRRRRRSRSSPRELGVTRERVRQIQAEALEKLRARLKRRGSRSRRAAVVAQALPR